MAVCAILVSKRYGDNFLYIETVSAGNAIYNLFANYYTTVTSHNADWNFGIAFDTRALLMNNIFSYKMTTSPFSLFVGILKSFHFYSRRQGRPNYKNLMFRNAAVGVNFSWLQKLIISAVATLKGKEKSNATV